MCAMPDSISFLIAGHKFRVVGDKESAMLRAMPGFPVFVAEYDEPEWQVVFGRTFEKPDEWKELYNFVFEADIMSCKFARKGDVYYFVMEPYDKAIPPLRMRYVSGSNEVEATEGADRDMLRFALWMALGLLSMSSKMLLIHSSTIVHQGRAVLFLGESGTGKSTHTRLWLKSIPDAHLLNDEWRTEKRWCTARPGAARPTTTTSCVSRWQVRCACLKLLITVSASLALWRLFRPSIPPALRHWHRTTGIRT